MREKDRHSSHQMAVKVPEIRISESKNFEFESSDGADFGKSVSPSAFEASIKADYEADGARSSNNSHIEDIRMLTDSFNNKKRETPKMKLVHSGQRILATAN